MGILDAPIPVEKRRPYNLIDKLERGKESAVLAILGDSTANGTDEWFYLTCQWLANKYPKYRVRHALWNDPTISPGPPTLGAGSYDAFTTLQAGVAAPNITDSFDRVDGPLASTDTGQAYTSVTGWTVSANKMSAGAASSSATLDPRQTDITLTVDVTLNSGFVRVYVRNFDSNNHIFVDISAGTLFIYKRIGGTATVLASQGGIAGLTAGSTNTLTVSVSGKTITVSMLTTSLSGSIADIDQQVLYQASSVVLTSSASGNTLDNLAITRPPLSLDCYNASTPGQITDYSRLRLSQQLPIQPDLTFVNYGHNEAGFDARPAYLALVRNVLDYQPKTQIVAVGQNPRAPSDPAYRAVLTKNSSILRLAAQEGWGYVNATSRFLANPNYATDWLLADGVHPSGPGSAVWANEVQNLLKPSMFAPPPVAGPQSRRLMSPMEFMVAESTPALAVFNSTTPAWSFDASIQQAIIGTVSIPSEWYRFWIYLLFTTAANAGLTSANNGILWEIGYTSLGDASMVTQRNTVSAAGGGVDVLLPPPALSTTQINIGVNNASAGSPYVARISAPVSPGGRPLVIRVRRVAADAADTYASSAYLSGIVLEKHS